MRSDRGSASVEQAGLILLVAVLCAAVAAAVLSRGGQAESRELARAVAQKIRCAAVGPGPCWQDPLTEAYGRPLAGLVRALAPAPETAGALGLLPVDFRRCRQRVVPRRASARTDCVKPPRHRLRHRGRSSAAVTGRSRSTIGSTDPRSGWDESPSGVSRGRGARTP